jgi:hypothetical protein
VTDYVETTDTTEMIDTTGTTSTTGNAPVTARKRVRWYHVAVLGVAVLACAGAVGFTSSQSSDRDDATADRRAAQSQLASQRGETRRARDVLVSERDDTRDVLASAEQITGSLRELNDLSAQEIAALTQLHQIAVNSPDDIDGFNAQYDRAYELGIQVYAKATSIEDQIDNLRQSTDAQFAAITSTK